MGDTSKVELGHGATEIISTAKKLTTKHTNDAGTSPLSTLTDINWNEISSLVPQAEAKHNEAELYRTKAETAYRERDILLEPITDAVRRSKNLLKSIHSKNPKVLSEWGFNVTYTATTTKAEKEAKAAKTSKRPKSTTSSDSSSEL